jgi:cytochrome c-type biogenesis protein
MNMFAVLTRRSRSRSPSNSRICLLVAAILALLASLFALAGSAGASDAPDYSAAWLDSGETFSLDDFRGEVVLLNLWATWCGPCKEEMPELGAISTDYHADGLVVIGVNIDRTVDNATIQQFALDHGAGFRIAKDPDNTFSSEFRASGVPETVLIDRNGEIAFHWKGQLEAGSAENRQIIADTLAGTFDESSAGTRIATVGFFAAFGAGLLSLLSPCVFPLLPTYAAWITGVSADREKHQKGMVLRNGLLFVLGFSTVFIALGASASLIGGWVHDYRIWMGRVGGVVLLVFGLHMLGVFRIAWLDRTVQPGFISGSGAGSGLGTFVVGVAFDASWTPCIGPILASILTVAASSTQPGEGVALLSVYSLGLAIPFLLCTVFIERFMRQRARINRWLPAIERVSGVLIVAVGVLIETGLFDQLASYASRFDAIV